MALHLVGETISKSRMQYLVETDKVVQLMRGIYVDEGADVDATVFAHAVRIAHYLYKSTYLSAASAVLLRPTQHGRLYLSGRRNLRTRIRGLEIVQNTAPDHPSLGSAIIADALGELRVDVSSIRQRFLEAFRLRSEHASSIDDDMRAAIAARLIEEYGTAQAASDAVWALARENSWYREGERAERFLLQRPIVAPRANLAALGLTVAWHGSPIGHLTHDGFEWRWTQAANAGPPLVRQTVPGRLPPFIDSLLPEGWLDSVLKDRNERDTLRSGRRYMSNITVVENPNELAALPHDILLTRLNQYTNGGVFTGTYQGPGRATIEESFESNLARLYDRAVTPRLSGVQIKAPMYLAADGRLVAGVDQPFTHILKPAGTGGYDALPLVEWTAMSLGRSAGFEVPEIALIAMPNDMPPALLVERFDVRVGVDDQRLLALEDLCSVLDLSSQDKYNGTMERIVRAIRPLSTQADEDIAIVFKRALFAWLIADGDMHLKNMALLKTAMPGSNVFNTVRLAPLYDAVTTRVFPRLETDRMALKLNGKDERLRRADFRALASTIGLPAAQADTAIDEMIKRLATAVELMTLPALPAFGPNGEVAVNKMLALCRTRLEEFE